MAQTSEISFTVTCDDPAEYAAAIDHLGRADAATLKTYAEDEANLQFTITLKAQTWVIE